MTFQSGGIGRKKEWEGERERGEEGDTPSYARTRSRGKGDTPLMHPLRTVSSFRGEKEMGEGEGEGYEERDG